MPPPKKLSLRSLTHLYKRLGTNRKELAHIKENISNYYRRKVTETKPGKVRHCDVPQRRLKQILKNLKLVLDEVSLPENMHGGVPGRSTITNATPHTCKATVINMDLKDYFPSIGYRKVYDALVKQQECSPDVASMITRLTTFDGHIPLGSPTSTVLANITSIEFAKRINSLAIKHGCVSTIYVDDITISGPPSCATLVSKVETIAKQCSLEIKREKTKVTTNAEEQIVTGFRVNQGLEPTSKYVKDLRKLVRAIKASGKGATDIELKSLKGKVQYIRRTNKRIANQVNRSITKLNKDSS